MDPSSSAAVHKNQKLLEKSDVSEVEDRISNLPDVLISRILSLSPTKSVVQTSVLSTRWKDLWLLTKCFEFEMCPLRDYTGDLRYYCRYEKHCMTTFTNFVDRLLVLRDNMSIEKFHFSVSTKSRFSFPHLYAWVSYLLMSNVQNLALELPSWGCDFPCELPWSLLTCKSLVVLKLVGGFLLDVPFYVSLPSLKTLHLKSIIYIDDASTQRLLSSCPIIEDLTIERTRGMGWDNACIFNVFVPSLRRLTIKFDMLNFIAYHLPRFDASEDLAEQLQVIRRGKESYAFKLVINAPNLEYLKLFDYSSEHISVTEFPFLVEAYISLRKLYHKASLTEKQRYGNYAYNVFRTMSSVQRLSLSGYSLQALCNSAAFIDDQPLPRFQNLVLLRFGIDQCNDSKWLLNFLYSSPNLVILHLPEGISSSDEYEWRAPNQVPECLLASLKRIRIRCFCGAREEQLKLVKYLLSNAMVLKRMTIHCHEAVSCSCFLHSYSFKDEVLNHPRGSSSCEVTLFHP